METRGNNKLKMYKAVQTVMASNGNVWNEIPAFVNAYDRFSEKVLLLDQLAFEQGTGTIGVKKVKDKDRSEAIELTNRIASALRVFATNTNDMGLFEQVHFSHSDLDVSGNLQTLQFINRVEIGALAHASELSDYGISEEMILDLVQRHEQLITALGSTRDAIVNRSKNTVLIKALIKEIDVILKMILDELVEVVKKEFPDFAISYHKAREVVDAHGKKHKSIGLTEPPLDPPVVTE